MSEPQNAFQPRGVYVAASYMSRVGKYNGRHLADLTFVDLAEQVHQIFEKSLIRREAIEAVVVGSQNPFAFNHVDNVAAKIAGLLGISGAKSVLIDTASSSGASAFENAYLDALDGGTDFVKFANDFHDKIEARVKAEKKSFWATWFCMFYIPHTWTNRSMGFGEIIKYAQTYDTRSREVCVEMNWMKSDGTLTEYGARLQFEYKNNDIVGLLQNRDSDKEINPQPKVRRLSIHGDL